MTLQEALTELAKRFTKTYNDEFRALGLPFLNDSYLEVGKSWDWVELDTYASIIAVPVVEGTVTLTAGSYTVTVAEAVAAWKGRFFRKKGGDNDYRIVYVDGTTLSLDQALIESGSITYEVEKRFYTLPTETLRIISFENRPFLTLQDNNALRQHLPNYSSPLIDNPFSVHGSDKFTDDYTTGLVSVAASTPNVITGAGGMAWLANAKAGNIIRFGNVDYRIRRIETDTRMVSYNKMPATSSVAYAIKQDNAKTVRMRGKFTANKVIPFQYIRSVFNLIHNDDTLDLSQEANLAVLDFAESYLASGPLKQEDWAAKLIKAQARLERAQALSKPVREVFHQFSPLIPSGLGRGRR